MGRTSVKLCTCGHGKSIHKGIFQVKRTGPTKCNFPNCRCTGYRPISARSDAAKRKATA